MQQLTIIMEGFKTLFCSLKSPLVREKKILQNLYNIWARGLEKVRQLWATETAKR